MILRKTYIEQIKQFIDVPIIKILCGVRRSGKSTILEMIKKEIKDNRGVKESNIISRKYNDIEFDGMNYKEMYKDLDKNISGKGKFYLFLDEVQEVENWEKVINDIFEKYNVDIYLTGSNSKLMSSEISTYLTGRFVSIPIFTLSFEEFIEFKKLENKDIKFAFSEYLTLGGFPLIALANLNTKGAYLVAEGIYSTVITKDIAKRHNIKNQELFDRVVRYIIENVGKTFSSNSIVKYLKNENRSISVENIYNYIKYLEEAFIIYPCSRYDLKGKSVLKTQEKYYLSDISIKYSKFGFLPTMISSMLENIVFLELKRRGYDVFIGKYQNKEIDFVAIKREDKIYIQVCRNIPENSEREIQNLKDLKDHYHKYVVTLDEYAKGNIDGIEIIHITDFLLKEGY